MAADYVYRLEQPHVAGQLAKVCARIADESGLIGDIHTVSIGRDRSIREISVEVRDDEQAKRVATELAKVDGVRVIAFWDRALHAHEGGKLDIVGSHEMHTLQDMRDVYTPGVARVCLAIADDPGLAHRFTMIGRTVAICTNGSRVLGLGDIGPVASMPVMEGKAMFYRQLAGISAMPILIDADDPDTFVETVKRIAGGFGGIHLEDIRAPDCFEIEARLISELDIPVMHDDVHGTAVATLGAVLVACAQRGDRALGVRGRPARPRRRRFRHRQPHPRGGREGGHRLRPVRGVARRARKPPASRSRPSKKSWSAPGSWSPPPASPGSSRQR